MLNTQTGKSGMNNSIPHCSPLGKVVRSSKRMLKLLLLGLVTYVVILLVGLIPVNNDFRPSSDGIQIFLVSNAVHSDIIVPVVTKQMNWSEKFVDAAFVDDVSVQSHVAFGWGDRGFFLRTKTWDDFKISTAANALLLPSTSCVHVSFASPEAFQDPVVLTISPEQYGQLVEFIGSTFEQDDQGKYLQIQDEAYSTNDAFFCSAGRYHLFNTCNSWVGRGLKTAGVKTPWFSPLPKTPILYITSEVPSNISIKVEP